MFTDLIGLAFKRMKGRMVESIVVIISLGFGLAIVSTVIGIIITFNTQISEVSDNPWQRRIYVYPAAYQDAGYDNTVTKIGSKEVLEKISFFESDIRLFKESCPSVDYTIIEEWVELIEPIFDESDAGGDTQSGNWWEVNPASNGINEDYLDFFGFEIESGTMFSEDDYENSHNVIILGGTIKQLLFADIDPVGEVLTYDDLDYTIIGYLKEKYPKSSERKLEEMKMEKWDHNNRVYLPYTTKSWHYKVKKVERFSLGIKDVAKLEAAVAEINYFIESEYPGGKINVESSLDWENDFEDTVIRLLKIMGFIAFVSLIIAALTNLNLMLAKVVKEKKGLGISQALGASKKTVFINTLLESSVLGILGTILGLILLVLFTYVFGMILDGSDTDVSLTLTAKNIVINLIMAIFITGLFSIFPAIEATKVMPSQVLRED